MLWISRIAVVLLVITAVLGSLARYVLPGYIEERKEELLAYLGEMAEQPIEADALSVEWRGDGPAVVMRNVRLYNKQHTVANLQAESVTLKFSLLGMLRHRNFTPEKIAVTGTHLVFIRHEDSSLSIHGIEQRDDAHQAAERADISQLLLQPEFLALSGARITVVDLLSEGRLIHFSPVNLQIENRGKHHNMAAALSIESGLQGDLTLIADLAVHSESGLLFWSGDIYMRAARLNLAWLLKDRIPGHYALESARTNLEAWSSWKDGIMQRLEGRMLTEDLRFRSLEALDAPALELDAISSELRWLREEHGWRLDMHQPNIISGLDRWPTRSVSIALRRFDEAQPLELFIGADVLDIKSFMRTLSVRPPDAEVVDHLLASGLRGQLRNPYLHLRMQRPLQWNFSGMFDDLSAYGTSQVPEMENYKVQVDMCNSGGRLRFMTENASFYARNLFRWPIPVTLFQGDIQWQRVRDGYWYVKSDSLALENDHAKTLTAFGLHIETGKPLYLDLETGFLDADGAYASIYYPAGIMPKESVRWLDNSIKHGRVVRGTATIRGELVRELFSSTDAGLFEVVADIEDATLKYHPEWPAIDDVKGRLRFFGNTLTVEADSGHIYNNPIEEARSSMTLIPLSPVNVKGSVVGDLGGPYRVLSETPLRELLGPLVQAVDISGEGKVYLDIDIPLKPDHELRLESRVDFDNARVHARDADITLEEIKGGVTIGDEGIRGEGLSAKVWEVPIQLAIARRGHDTLITASLELSEKLLMQLAGVKMPLTGSAPLDLALTMPGPGSAQSATMQLTATSNLKGMAVQLPLSLAKPAGSTRATRVRWQPGSDKVDINYGDVLRLQTAGDGSALIGDLDAEDLQGSLRYPLDGGTLVMNLEKLAISPESGERKSDRLQPFDIPPLDVNVKHLLIKDSDFGRMRLRTRHTASAHEVNEFAISGEIMTFTATGNWTRGGSSIKGKLTSQRLGETLRKLDITDQVTDARGNIELGFDWPGSLLEFSLKKAQGDIRVSTSEGRITSANPGFGRILGLVNVSALKRRLTLDFSDLTEEGFAFDDISAHLTFADGVATLESVTVKAPAADIHASGNVDLESRALDQEIRVLPDLHGALPLAATAAAGPGAGAVALVISEIAGKQIDKMAEVRYRVTGTLDDPVIERIGRDAGDDGEGQALDADHPLADFHGPEAGEQQEEGLDADHPLADFQRSAPDSAQKRSAGAPADDHPLADFQRIAPAAGKPQQEEAPDADDPLADFQ
jgi:uncharacterized protein YhdP